MDPLEQLHRSRFGTDRTTLVLPVTDPLEACYAVTCEQPPADVWRAAEHSLAAVTPLDLLDDVRFALGPTSGICVVEAWRAPPIRWRLVASAGGAADEIARARAARWHLLVRCQGRPGRRMVHQWAALAVARALQRETGGVLVDVEVDRLLPPSVRSGQDSAPVVRAARAEPVRDALAEQRRDLVSTWIWTWHSFADGGCWMTTDGLKRFGLAELSLHAIAPEDVLDAHHLLMGLAHRLVADQARELGHLVSPPAFRTVPRAWTITGRDRAAAFDVLPGSGGHWGGGYWGGGDVAVTVEETANDAGAGIPMLEVRAA